MRFHLFPFVFALLVLPLTAGVKVEICEDGVPMKNEWPAEPRVTESYEAEAMGFTQVPQKYVASGVRGNRSSPYLFRATTMVELPAGTHRLLVRGRGACRVFVDDRQVLETPFAKRYKDGHAPVALQDHFLDLGGDDFRFVQPGDREAWVEIVSPGGAHEMVLEQMVGLVMGNGASHPELGETVLAISLEGSDEWRLVSPEVRIDYSNRGWETYLTEQREKLERLNRERRAELRSKHANYWDFRRKEAAAWLAATEEVPLPPAVAGMPENNEIDRFLNAKIAAVRGQLTAVPEGGVRFHREVLPILEKHCFSCHQGEKTKGGLALHDRAAALKGGRSDGPAVVPGSPEESALIARVTSEWDDEIMPPKGDPLKEDEVGVLRKWIAEGASWPELDVDFVELTEPAPDLVFLRRLFLDMVGVPPGVEEIAEFEADSGPGKRSRWIHRLLADERWADRWMGYWQDVLAENPNILNPTLNNTGPFRWWIHESLVDNKPMDVFVTELVKSG